nr:hypothetical protein [Pseudonocardia sp. ICBG1142]
MSTTNVVPGDPAELHTFAAELTRFSQTLEATGSALRAVDTQSGWSGPAADAFRDSFGRFTPQWFTAADAFRDAGPQSGATRTSWPGPNARRAQLKSS